MNRSLILAISFSALSACATTFPEEGIALADEDWSELQAAVQVENAAEPVVRYIDRVETLPLQGQLKRVSAKIDTPVYSPTEAIRAGVAGARIEPSMDGFVNAVQVLPYSEGALYRLYCAPGQVSDIALEPGEELISVSAGDTVRWVVGDTRSGAGPNARSHVLVKPHTAGLTTNLMIATNRRSYYLEMESTDDSYMAALSWRYPGQDLQQMRGAHAAKMQTASIVPAAGPDLDRMNFDYRISGDDPDWRPVRAFDDGTQVFIQMPDDIGTSDMPPLFVLGKNGNAELVNYRIRGRYYVVDYLFDRAELRYGTKHQQAVRISKQAERRTLWEEMFGG